MTHTTTNTRLVELLTQTLVLHGTAPTEAASLRLMDAASIIAATMSDDDARGAFEDAKARVEGMAAPQHVWVLTAQIDFGGGDWDGISTAHATFEGALAHLNEWLTAAEIDLGSAHYGEVRTDTSLCNDPDPDLLLDGAVLHWGINKAEVRA